MVALAVVCLNGWLLVHFHDRFWWAADEGNYAHVAERLLEGAVLHADVQDVHPGHVNFANAAAMAIFGRELVSMRYPLVALGVLQSGITYALLLPIGITAAAVGATTITALGFLQFLDPTAHWYALFLALLLAYVMHAVPARARFRLDAIGAIVATAVLFRQLSGVFLAMAALTCLLLERPGPEEGAGDTPWLARSLVAVMLLALVAYLGRATDAIGWLLFGVWPVLLLLWTARATRRSDRAVIGMIARLARGGAAAALPLVAYHVSHDSLGAWYDDVVVTALSLPRLPFFDAMSYAGHLHTAGSAVASGRLVAVVNGAFWIVLPFVAPLVGLLVLRRAALPGRDDASRALPVIAVFYAVVSVHYQIPIYLTYTVGLSFVALLWLTRATPAVVAGGAILAVIATVFHAGQPLSRGVAGAAEGRRVALVAADAIPRLGLAIEARDLAVYQELIRVIHREVPPDSAILAVPSHAELYFLADRPNPFRFFNTALGARTPQQLAAVLERLERRPPRLVVHDPADKYNTPASAAIMAHVQAQYERLESVGPFDIYRSRSGIRR